MPACTRAAPRARRSTTSAGPPTPPAATSGHEGAPPDRGQQRAHGPVRVGAVVVGQARPGAPPPRQPCRQSASGPTRRAAAASSGVVTVSTTSEPAACSDAHHLGVGDAEGEADRRRAGRASSDLELGRVVVVVPRRARPGRHTERGRLGGERRHVRGRPAPGSAAGMPGHEDVDAEGGTPAARTAAMSARQRLAPSCSRRPGSRTRRRAPPPLTSSTVVGRPPWAPPRGATAPARAGAGPPRTGRARGRGTPQAYPAAATVGNSWTSTSSPRCAARAQHASSTPSRSPTTCSSASSTRPASPRAAGTARAGASSWSRTRRPRAALRDLYLSGWYEYLAMGSAGLVPWAPVTDREAEAAAIADAGQFAEAGAAAPGFAETLDTAPALLLVLADLAALAAVDRDLPRYTLVGGASIYPFVWSLLLAARAEGLGGVMTTVAVRREADVRALFGIPDTVAVAALVVLGRPVAGATPADAGAGERPSPGSTATRAHRSDGLPRPPGDRAEHRGQMGHGTERPRRRSPALQLRPAHRLLPRRLLQHRRRGPGRAHGVHPGDRRVPGPSRPRSATTCRPRTPSSASPGLQPGDQWCLCAPRWQEAFEAGVAPPVVLASTHAATLEWVQLGDLVAHAIVVPGRPRVSPRAREVAP